MKVCLMGVGNVLMGDDALGPWVIASLQSVFEFPPEVTVVDAGASGLDLTIYLDGFDALIVVDALNVQGAAGEVRAWRRRDLLAGAVPVVMSPHEPSLREALLRLQLLGRCPQEILLVGAIPLSVGTGAELSGCVRRAVPEIEAEVVNELRNLGVHLRLRDRPLEPDFWWERSPACVSASPAG
jgi:hydrogenase maturation protease